MCVVVNETPSGSVEVATIVTKGGAVIVAFPSSSVTVTDTGCAKVESGCSVIVLVKVLRVAVYRLLVQYRLRHKLTRKYWLRLLTLHSLWHHPLGKLKGI